MKAEDAEQDGGKFEWKVMYMCICGYLLARKI